MKQIKQKVRKEDKIKIKEISYAVGFRIGNNIYLNKELKAYPDLRKAILKHELEHTDGFSWKDIKLDLLGKNLKSVKSEYWKFIIKNPKSLIQFLPLLKINGKWTLDLMMLGGWLLFLLVLIIMINILR
jgi:hypothetical protein